MEKCNDCWTKEFKDSKDRPISCAGCELNYYCSELGKAISKTLIGKFVIGIIKKLDNLLSNI